MFRFLLGCLMAAFFVSNAWAGDVRGYIIEVPIFCAYEGQDLLEEAKEEGKELVWTKKDFGGGVLSLLMNVKTEEWSLLRFYRGAICKVASSPNREVGT